MQFLVHKAGDKILFELSQAVRNSIRKSDAVFRVGGEEFAIITPETGLDDSFKIAETIRKKIEEKFCKIDFKVTISLGVVQFLPGKTQKDMYQQATVNSF
ncbi:MAG: GGDEF domain-containing protein [Desulfobacterium sp.]|jgi:diguanylate cyclase (GGDEF)-like protein|nr:GGDEF domain-containing protein [Desulfobacterium sp.]